MPDEIPQAPIIVDRRNQVTPSQEEIKRAVKEALMDKSIEDLKNQINHLGTQMEVGFAGVHNRQDMTNGKVLKAREDIDKINSKSNYDRLIWYLLTTAVAVITYLLTKR